MAFLESSGQPWSLRDTKRPILVTSTNMWLAERAVEKLTTVSFSTSCLRDSTSFFVGLTGLNKNKIRLSCRYSRPAKGFCGLSTCRAQIGFFTRLCWTMPEEIQTNKFCASSHMSGSAVSFCWLKEVTGTSLCIWTRRAQEDWESN